MSLLLAILALIGPPLPPAVTVAPSSTPATFTLRSLVFDAVPGATGYRIYVTPIVSRIAGSTATNWTTTTTTNPIPHLLYGQLYWIQAMAFNSMTESALNLPLEWPPPLTNFATLSFQQSSNLNKWQAFGPAVVVTNPAGFFRIAGTMTNNLDEYQMRE